MTSLYALAAAILFLTHTTVSGQHFSDGAGGFASEYGGITATCSAALNQTLECNGL